MLLFGKVVSIGAERIIHWFCRNIWPIFGLIDMWPGSGNNICSNVPSLFIGKLRVFKISAKGHIVFDISCYTTYSVHASSIIKTMRSP